MFKDWIDILAAAVAVLIILVWLAHIPWTFWKDRRQHTALVAAIKRQQAEDRAWAEYARLRFERALAKNFTSGEALEKLL